MGSKRRKMPTKNKYFITLNQWFNESLLNEIDIQPLYYPSINKVANGRGTRHACVQRGKC